MVRGILVALYICMGLYMHICEYLFMYIYIYIYMFMKDAAGLLSCTRIWGYISMSVYIFMYLYIHIHKYMYIYVYLYTCIYISIDTLYIQCVTIHNDLLWRGFSQ